MDEIFISFDGNVRDNEIKLAEEIRKGKFFNKII